MFGQCSLVRASKTGPNEDRWDETNLRQQSLDHSPVHLKSPKDQGEFNEIHLFTFRIPNSPRKIGKQSWQRLAAVARPESRQTTIVEMSGWRFLGFKRLHQRCVSEQH